MLEAMPTDTSFYIVGIAAVILLGLSKGGFAGIGVLGTPLMALAVGPVKAAAILLPVLIVQDVVGVWSFRHLWDGPILATMLPGAVIGIGLGYLYAAQMNPRAVMTLLGAISIVFAARSLWLLRGYREPVPSHAPPWFGFLMGVLSGFTSQFAHAGAPPFQIYVLPKRLARDTLVGTTAIFFAAVNWFKVPAYVALGQFDASNMLASAVLLPIAIASTFAGVWLVRHVSPQRFYAAIYCLMILVGGKLLIDGLG